MPDTIVKKSHDRHVGAYAPARPPVTHAELAEKVDSLGDLASLSLQSPPRSPAEQSADGFNNIEELRRILMNGDGGSEALTALLEEVGELGDGELNSFCGIVLERLREMNPPPFTDEYGFDASTISVAEGGVLSAEEQARLGLNDTDALDRSIQDGGGEVLKALRDSIYGWNALAGGEAAGLAALLAFDTQVLANLRAAQAAGVTHAQPVAPSDYGLNGLDVSLIETTGLVPEEMQAENGWSNSETLELMLGGGAGSDELRRARGYVYMCAGGGIAGEMALEQYDGQVLAAMRAAHLPFNREFITKAANHVDVKALDAHDLIDSAKGLPRGEDGWPLDISAWLDKVLVGEDGGSSELADRRAWIGATSGPEALAEFDRRVIERLFRHQHPDLSVSAPPPGKPGLRGDPATYRFFSNDNLFGKAGGPQLDDINQGKIGDCYLLAALAGLTVQQPDLIRDAIEWDPDAEVFKVTLYVHDKSGKPVAKVFDVTQQELWDNIDHRGGSTIDDSRVPKLAPDWQPTNAVWPAVFEVAYAKALDKNPADGYEQGQKDLGDGGKVADVLFALTGVEGRFDVFQPPRKNTQAWLDAKAREIERALSEGRPVTLSTDANGKEIKRENGLYNQHAYAVLGVHQDEHGEWWLDLRDPHGTALEYDDEGPGIHVNQPEISVKLSSLIGGPAEGLTFGEPA